MAAVSMMKPVYSSHIDEIGYDAEAREFHVKYSSSRTVVVYDGVPPEVAAVVMASPSIGEAIHANIRGKYSYRGL